jgi:DNA-3-methyladenine glycosylase
VVARITDRRWFERDAPDLAVELLNKLLVTQIGGVRCTGRIVEVEAYTSDDPASHTFNGITDRNAVMFGPPGHLYVYLSYGIHSCANVVAGSDGDGQAVLLRALEPIDGVEAMIARRSGRRRELANGPGKLCQAMGIGLRHGGLDLLHDAGVDAGTRDGVGNSLATEVGAIAVVDDGTPPPTDPIVGPRVGISKGVETPWRFRTPAAS